MASDSDGDGLDDSVETGTGIYLSPGNTGTDPAQDDTDGDGLKDGYEIGIGRYSIQPKNGELNSASSTWSASKQSSEDSGAHLATITSQTELDAIKSVVSLDREHWLGGHRFDGTWKWVTGEAMTFSDWQTFPPTGASQVCMYYSTSNDGEWRATADVSGKYHVREIGFFTSPVQADTDGDGLNDGDEISAGTIPSNVQDSDGDGLFDGVEVHIHGSNPLLADSDSDGLSDFEEVTLYGSDATLRDSDGDGFDDKFEVETGYDPALASSTPETFSEILRAVEFRFNAAAGSSYRIEKSIDLETWEPEESGIEGTGGSIVRFYSIQVVPKRWLRAVKE